MNKESRKQFNVNMGHFRERFKVTADNVDIFENVTRTRGIFWTMTPEKYIEEFNLFNIFYTLK